MLRVPDRPRGADTDRFDPAVDALEQQIEPPCAKPAPLQHRAKPAGQMRNPMGQRLRCADRFGEGISDMDQFGRPERRDRFGEAAKSLIEAAPRFGAEAQGERCSRHRHQIGDRLETEPMQPIHALHIKAQRGDRQGRQRGAGLAGSNDRQRIGRKPCQRMCGPDRIGKAGACGDHRRLQARQQIAQQLRLAAMQMRGAGHVDQQTIGRIERDIRAVAAQGPRRQSLKRGGIRRRIARRDMQAGNPRLRLGERQARPHSERLRGLVGGYQDAPPAIMAGDHQRLVKSRRRALLPAQPVGRPGRKEQRDDPAHRTPPRPIPPPRRREPGPAQAASARGRCRAPATVRTAER